MSAALAAEVTHTSMHVLEKLMKKLNFSMTIELQKYHLLCFIGVYRADIVYEKFQNPINTVDQVIV